MVRAPAHALTRSNGFALLQPAEKPQLDSARILTMSGTIAVNLLALGLLMLPLSLPPAAIVETPDRDPDIVWHKRELPKPEPVEIVKKTTPTPADIRPVTQRPVAQMPIESASTEIVTDAGSQFVAVTSTSTGPTDAITPVSTGPAPMQLEYRLAPAPAYPRRALQQRLTGTVMLEVLVGLDGQPLAVTVARSSGHRELDEAARAQVLKRWRFQPATRDGLAVQAIGMVPIEFALKD